MSKIEQFNQADGKAKRLEQFAENANSPQTDKFGGSVGISGTYMGYYGNSSAYEWSTEAIEAIASVLQSQLRTAARIAAVKARAAAEEARIAAQDEARAILGQLEEPQ